MPHPVHCFFGVCDPVDALNAAVAFDRLPHAKHHLVWSSHANHDHLYSLNIIRRLIMTFNRPPEIELASKNLLADVPVKSLEQFGLTAEQLMSGNQVSVSGLRALPCFEQNPGMIWLAAKISEVQGDLQTALSWIEKAEDLIAHSNVLSTLPKRWRKQLPLHRIRLLCQLGRTYDACDLMIQTSKVFPVDRAMKDLGETLGLNLELSTDQPAP
ncbi:hypothetical protein E1178_14000 [Roseibium hamelinense]|nr:hypothetical protein [Roseibium hamelinense]MTI44722.1 hypothetical protein [Roseibium hamelinense]